MKKELGKHTYFFPLPVLIIGTYDEEGRPNAMNAAWGGVYDTDKVFVCLSSDHKTTQNIVKKRAFSISFADKEHVSEADYFGIASGNSVIDKISVAKMNVVPSNNIEAPIIQELPVALECKVISIMSDDNDTTFVIADIVNVLAEENVLNNVGKIDLDKVKFISYDPSLHRYYSLGEKVGNAFEDGLKIKK